MKFFKNLEEKRHIFFGLFFIALSFVYWALPGHPHLVFFNALFYMGNILFFDALSHHYSGFSLLHVRNRRKHFLALGLVFGILLEFYFNWVGRFWYYPRWDMVYYLVIFIPGYAAYSFYLLETYLGTKAVLEHFFAKRHKPKDFSNLGKHFVFLGIVSAAAIGAITTWVVVSMPKIGFKNFFKIYELRQGNQDNWYWFALIGLFVWLFLEYLEFRKRETSLIYEIIKGNLWPFLALLLSAFVSAILYEIFNIPGGLWRYAYGNVPFENIKILSFPILVYVGWPLHYLWAFSLYRLLYKKETENLFR